MIKIAWCFTRVIVIGGLVWMYHRSQAPCVADSRQVCVPWVVATDNHGGLEQGSYGVPIALAQEVWQVNVGRIAWDMPQIPAQALVAALKQESKANLFRVSWNSRTIGSMQNEFSSTVLYNRNAHTVRYFCSEAYYAHYGGSHSPPTESQSHCLAAGVTDEMIQKLVTDGNLTFLTPETAGFTKDLTQYGANIVSFASQTFVKPRTRKI